MQGKRGLSAWHVIAGAHFAGAGVRYVCVAGAAVRADRAAPRSTVQRYADAAYSQAHMHACLSLPCTIYRSAWLKSAQKAAGTDVIFSLHSWEQLPAVV
jgi:hypothetical protein